MNPFQGCAAGPARAPSMEAPRPRKKAPWEPSRISARAAPRTLRAAGSTARRSRSVSSGYVA